MPNLPGNGLDEELNLVTDWLLCASSLISDEHILLPIAGSDPRHRERVYCYELYHRWRSHWPESFLYSLCGEVDKRGHLLICGKNLSNTIPDFLVHVPGYMNNLLVMEVKPYNAERKRMANDLKKLTAFRRNLLDEKGRPANYNAAYFWIYGLDPSSWPQLRSEVLSAVDNMEEVDFSLIRCFVHERAGTRAVKVEWQEERV